MLVQRPPPFVGPFVFFAPAKGSPGRVPRRSLGRLGEPILERAAGALNRSQEGLAVRCDALPAALGGAPVVQRSQAQVVGVVRVLGKEKRRPATARRSQGHTGRIELEPSGNEPQAVTVQVMLMPLARVRERPGLIQWQVDVVA